MRIEVDRFTIHIIPETEQDVAFIVDTMKLGIDGEEIKLERIDASSEPMGFRLETDVSPYPANYVSNRGDTQPIKDGLFQRPLDDFIDCKDSWDGPPYSRTSPGGDTKVDNKGA